MKKMMRIAALAAALAFAAVNTAAAKDLLAILPFTGGQGEDGETIAELFSFEKDLTAAFTPVPRTSINIAIRNEQGFQMGSGMTDPDTIAALGKQLGAQYVVAGSIAALGSQKLLIIAIIKIDELRQVAGDVQTYSAISEIRGKLPAMAKNIVEASRKDASTLPRLAVPPVRLAGGADTRDADTLAQLLAAHLVRSGKYAVYPRTKSLEQVQTEYGNQFGGDVADEYLPSVGMGNNPRLVLSVTARKLDKDTMFNAAVINLESGVQEGGDSVDYKSLEDGVRVMEELALKLSGEGERAARINAAEAAAKANAERERREAEAAKAALYTLAVRDAASFERAIAAINSDAGGGSYTITLNASFTSAPVAFTGNALKTITLKGDGTTRTISNKGGGGLFTVPEGVTFVLDNGVTLNGGNKEAGLVSVLGGTFVMKTGSTVRRAKNSGVYVGSGGAFTMEGGTITGNSAAIWGNGGGVLVGDGGTFTMEGGEIRGNTAKNYGGGGVYVGGGMFTMEGGTISGNSAKESGGGVFVDRGGTFTMEGGAISGNTAKDYGGGVCVKGSGTFIKRGRSVIDATNSAPRGKVAYVYINNSTYRARNSAAGQGVNMDSRLSGSAGGWE
jgi:TolB-like protein